MEGVITGNVGGVSSVPLAAVERKAGLDASEGLGKVLGKV